MRMNKEEFIQFIAKNIKYHLPSDFNSYQIEVNHMRLTISDSNSSKQLNVYLDRAYEQFMQVRSMFPIMENVAKNIAEKWSLMSKRTEEKRQAVNLVNNYNEAKKYLQATLCDPDMSAIAPDRVTTKAGSYIVLYQLNLDTNDLHTYIPITNRMIDRWEITKEQLYEDTMKVIAVWNQPFLAEWEQEAFYLQFGTPKPENLLESDRGKIESDTIYILSNKALDNGAVLIVQPEIIEKVGDLLQQNYYLFPSSRHEMLVYPNSGHSMTAQEMETMVRRMNEQERSPEDLLSDKVLFYDYQERKLKLAAEREKELVEENELQEDKISEKAENQPKKKEEKTMGITPRF